MALTRNAVETSKFNKNAKPPYELRMQDFQMAMQDVYDFFYDVNSHLTVKGLQRLDDMLRPAIMSGLLSDMLTASLATRHNAYFTKFFMCGFWTVTSPHRHSEANYFSPSFQTGIC